MGCDQIEIVVWEKESDVVVCGSVVGKPVFLLPAFLLCLNKLHHHAARLKVENTGDDPGLSSAPHFTINRRRRVIEPPLSEGIVEKCDTTPIVCNQNPAPAVDVQPVEKLLGMSVRAQFRQQLFHCFRMAESSASG